MFCKFCGTKNPENSLYCMNDGVSLTTKNEGLIVTRSQAKYCKSCSHEIEKNSLYCSQCGCSQEVITENNVASAIESSVSSLGKLTKNNLLNRQSVQQLQGSLNINSLLSSAKHAGIAFGILFVFSIVISSYINSNFRKALSSEFFGEAGNLLGKLKIVSFSDIMMISHLSGVTYEAQAIVFEGIVTAKGGLFLLAIIPAIALIISGYLATKNSPDKSAIERVYTAIPISVFYALFVGVLAIFAGVKVDIPMEWLGAITVKADYQLSIVVLNSFVIAIIFVTIGSMLSQTKEIKEASGNIGFGMSIYRAILHSILGLIICTVIAYGVIGLNENFKNDSMPGAVKAAIITQTGGYFWNLGHFNTLSLEFKDRWEAVKAEYSIVGGGKTTSIDEDASFNAAIKDLFGTPWYLFLVPLFIHFWAGRELAKWTTNNVLSEVGVYAFAFGIINALLFSIARFSLDTTIEGTFALSFGFPFFTSFIFGAIFAFAAAFLGLLFAGNFNTSRQKSVI